MSATTALRDARYDIDPAASYRTFFRAAEAAVNPLLEAARPLLDALSTMPVELDTAGVAQYRQWLVQHLRMFGKICGELGVPAGEVEKARYCLCSALDEAAGLTGWGNGARPDMDWHASGLATTFGHDRQGGDRVFAIATDAVGNLSENRYLIEVIQHILDRGFKGRYRFASGSSHRIAVIRKQVAHAVITSARCSPVLGRHVLAGRAYPAYRLRAEPQRIPRKSRRWPAVGALCIVLLAVAAAVGYWRHPAASPLDALASRLRGHLASEVNAGTITLAENAQHTMLTLRLGGMFEAGQSAVNPWVKLVIATMGKEIAPVPGSVLVTGHTDGQPFAHTQHNSNQALSEARAQEVAKILVSAGVAADRIDATGKGNAEPIDDNSTPQGRLRNRRVEITIFPDHTEAEPHANQPVRTTPDA